MEITERCAAISRAVRGDGDLDSAVADLLALPAHLPVRGPLAAGLIDRILSSGPAPDLDRLRHLDALLAVADRDPPAGPDWERRRSAARALALMVAAAEGRLGDPGAALAELDTLAEGPAGATMTDLTRMVLRYQQRVQHGDESAVARLTDDFTRLRDKFADVPALRPTLGMLDLAHEVMATHDRGDDPAEALARLREATGQLPADHPMRVSAENSARMIGPLNRLKSGPAGETDLAALRELAAQPGLAVHDRALYLAATGMSTFQHETDPARVDAGIEQVREALLMTPPSDPQRPFYLGLLALGLMRREELGGPFDSVREAAQVLEEARALAGGPRHPQWSMLSEMLTSLRRRLPEADRPGLSALEGLRGYAWRALVQPNQAAAKAAVRDAARDAIDIARQCLSEGGPADALRALDAGRGLTLFAATQTRGVAERLERAGRARLAARWRAASAAGDPDQLPADLRTEVWSALTAAGGDTGLLDTPGLAEIRGALAALDADALVYLVPADGVQPGLAVIAPVGGPPAFVALPHLRVEQDVDVERYLTALARRDDVRRDLQAAGDEFGRALETMCDWAWRAAIGPLIERALPQLTRPHPGRVPRVVLVPMGELARIPWQAARGGDGRFAVQRIAISQAASARMLCHSAALAPVPAGPLGLVVGDPDTTGGAPDLPAARLEAYAVHRSFYRAARYVGRRPDGRTSSSGAGTAEQVRAWLTATTPDAGSTLHLACHGVIESSGPVTTSHLLLAGGDRLAADELVELMGRAPEREVGLVVLAACRTGLSIHGYDEAYSLGTALLAGGARSVLTTQWGIPDRATSVLMFLFHHYLVTHQQPPWQALRDAQLWMLDPAHDLDVLPGPLRTQLAGADSADVAAWAGFMHWGQ
ncbi:CHAT domain-containing protein [Paractinoplanes lichenicola]|uniref:CHAT domain-containing protein n=1 Tax=Paractinoplanes lichenicola TaxID=2802976 RepID=A0ABS1VU69_9ACTN|nr:CHAT domain-containing protein [Actinoplanes lichenicola]MBL7258023.1 CHAT domain-containing protein [Actinoplanes lichenicola]